MPQIRWFAAFRISSDRPGHAESIVVRAADGNGTVGWGEAMVPAGTEGAVAERDWSAIEDRASCGVLQRPWEQPAELLTAADFDSPYAAAAVDIACWDLWCRLRGVPLGHALGGTRTSVMAGATLAAERDLDTLLVRVNRHVSAGFARITLTVLPGWDTEPVRAVRAAFPALALQVDADGAYAETPAHLAALEALDGYGLVALERPFAAGDLAAHARLQDRVRVAVAPEIGDLDTLDTAIRDGAGRALALRPGPLGGLDAARIAHDRAAAAGWDVWCADARGAGIAQAAAVALAALPGCTRPSDLTTVPPGYGSPGGPKGGVVSPPVRADGGVVAVPLAVSGLGHQIDEDRVRALATQALRIPA